MVKVFIVSVVVMLISSNNSIGLFIYSMIVLLSLCSLLISEGPESLSYFFLIAEVSALFVFFLASISKKIKKRSFKNIYMVPILVLSILIISKGTPYLTPVFFKFNSNHYLNNTNDFNTIVIEVYLRTSNISIVILLLLFMSLILIHLLKSSNTNDSKLYGISKSKNNSSINNKITLNKWF